MSSFCTAHFFSKKFQHICVSLDVNFNESLTNDVVSFEQLGPDLIPHVCFIMEKQESILLVLIICAPLKQEMVGFSQCALCYTMEVPHKQIPGPGCSKRC